MKEIQIQTILEYLEKRQISYQFQGDKSETIKGISTLYHYKEGTITWLKNQAAYETVKETTKEVALIVLPRGIEGDKTFKNRICVENPKAVFFDILDHFYREKPKVRYGNHNTIDPSAKIGENVSIGNGCVIEENVEIGEGSCLHHNVVIHSGVKIGRSCNIQSGAVIGEDGFGYSQNEAKEYIHAPHFGSVVIGDNVDIGANTCIVRGTIDDTVIEDGVKIENLCHIGHNVRIGKNSMLIVFSMIAGRVEIGENCYIASSIVRNQLKIGNNAFVRLGSVVVKDVPENALVYGNPAREKQQSRGGE